MQTIGVIKAFFLPGGLFKFVGAQGTGKNAGLWFAKVYQYPGWLCEMKFLMKSDGIAEVVCCFSVTFTNMFSS